MRLHVVSLPHMHTINEAPYTGCAYTQKVRKFANMMTGAGHEVFLYATNRNDADCAEHVNCATAFAVDGSIPPFDPEEPIFRTFNRAAIAAIRARIEPRDIVCLIGGRAQQPIADAFPTHLVCEFGVGYEGVLDSTHRVFESYAWMHTVYGHLYGAHRADGRFFDDVIPNYFDPDDFPHGDGDGGYLLYVGRLIERKGVRIAVDAANAAGLPLKIAGAPGDWDAPDDTECYGLVGPEERARLMGGAVALLAPTLYLEPFGGVAVECQMCGTPAITTDWGGFIETVRDGVTGFRCRTLSEFVDAIGRAPKLDRELIRANAIGRYSLNAIQPMYERYFDRLSTLWDGGFYQESTCLSLS